MHEGNNQRRHRSAGAAAIGVAVAAIVVVGPSVQATAARTSGPPSAVPPGTITTIAGGLGGPGPGLSLSVDPCGRPVSRTLACGLAFHDGQVYFSDYVGEDGDSGAVRALSIHGGQLTTPAGDGVFNDAGDGDLAQQAGLLRPVDVFFDHLGNLLIADQASVRVVARHAGVFYGQPMAAGHIYPVAGGGDSRASGVAATSAVIKPQCAIVDHAGNIVICGTRSIRVVAASSGTFYGQSMTAGDIYTIAGNGSSTADGVAAGTALLRPTALAVDADGNLLMADTFGPERVRLLATSTGTFYGQPMTAGDLYSIAGGGHSLHEGVPALQTSLTPLSLTIDGHGNVVIADFLDNLVRVVAKSTGRFYGQSMRAGSIYKLAGGGTSTRTGAVATSASLPHPGAVTLDSAGNIVVANRSFELHVIAERTGVFYGLHMSARHLYSVAGNGQRWASGDGGSAKKAQILAGRAVAYDGDNLLTTGATFANGTMISQIKLVPHTSGTFFGQEMKVGHIYVVAGDNQGGASRFGVRASATPIGFVSGLAVDARGNVLFSDTSSTIKVLAARTGTFYGQRMKTGFLYKIAGDGSSQDSGDGGPATKAGMEPGALVVDSHGNVVFAAALRLRAVAVNTGTFYGVHMKAGRVYTIAGDGTAGTGGDGGPALDAELSADKGLTRDDDGLLFSDSTRVRMIATATGTFFGVPMKAGDIYTIAGTASAGSSGDGGAATSSAIVPGPLSVNTAGNLVFFDVATTRIRVVPGSAGTFYGISMKADDLYTIVGGGDGSLGDGGPGTKAAIILFVVGIAQGHHGVAFSEADSPRIRFVTR